MRNGKRKRWFWRRGFSRLLLVPVLGAAVAVPLGLEGMARRDAEHARFYNTGSSVKGFLGDYCKALEEASRAGGTGALEPFYAPDYFSSGRGALVLAEPSRQPGVEISQLERRGDADFDRDDALAELGGYLAALSAVERTECKIHLIEEVELDRRVTLTVRFVLDGLDEAGQRLQDRHFYRWRLESPADAEEGTWRIAGDELVSGTRTVGTGAFFELDPRLAGIDFEHRRDPNLDREVYAAELLFDVIQHASGGLSAADYDLDGRPDLFFADGVRCRLYRNEGLAEDGTPRFSEVTAEAGLDGIDRAHSAIFLDHDNDGDRDLFVARYLAPSRFYENLGDGSFAERSAALGLDFAAPATSATALDFDRDGYLDLYVGVYGNAFEAVPRLPFYATNGGPNRLLRNDAGRRFVDVSAASGTADTGWSLAVATADVDGDGWPDLAVANDFGRKTLYRNAGDGTFTDVTREAGVLDFSGGMGLAFGDYDDDGRIDLYTSNIYSNQRWYGEDLTIHQYMRNVLRTRWALLDFGEYVELYRLLGDRWRELGQMIGEGNGLFHNEGDGTFTELHDSPTSFAGWSWSVAFFDFDNDRDLDLYAANGWITAAPFTDL